MSGTKGTKEKTLSSRDVCDIISSCAQHKVSVLKFGDLYVRIGQTAEDQTAKAIADIQGQAASTQTNSDTAISEPDHELINKQGLEDEELKTRDDQFAELLITNPLAAEEMLMNEELEDDVDDEYGTE